MLVGYLLRETTVQIYLPAENICSLFSRLCFSKVFFPTAFNTKKSFKDTKIMKYSNWKEAFNNDPKVDTYNKNAAAVIKFLHKPADEIEYSQNIVNEPGLISISVAPITNDIQVFHHMTKIGGTLTNPVESIVGLKGFLSHAHPV